MNELAKAIGANKSANRKANGARHKFKIQGLWGLARLEASSPNSGMIFAIILLVCSFVTLWLYMWKTL